MMHRTPGAVQERPPGREIVLEPREQALISRRDTKLHTEAHRLRQVPDARPTEPVWKRIFVRPVSV